MNVKIGELVEYVEVLKSAHHRRLSRMQKIVEDLVAIKKELEEQADGDAQLIKNLELQVKVAEEQVKVEQERVESCTKCFKELEDLWGKRDQNIMYWFKANNLGEDRAKSLTKFLLDYQGK